MVGRPLPRVDDLLPPVCPGWVEWERRCGVSRCGTVGSSGEAESGQRRLDLGEREANRALKQCLELRFIRGRLGKQLGKKGPESGVKPVVDGRLRVGSNSFDDGHGELDQPLTWRPPGGHCCVVRSGGS